VPGLGTTVSTWPISASEACSSETPAGTRTRSSALASACVANNAARGTTLSPRPRPSHARTHFGYNRARFVPTVRGYLTIVSIQRKIS